MPDEILASDAEREQAVVRLRDASAEGRLTLDELAARTGSAYAARTHGELVAVTADLPAAQTGQAVRKRRRLPGLVLGIFSPVGRRRRWRLREHTLVLTVFAPATLDLRTATFEAEVPTIVLLGVFAPVTITVPEHVEVDTYVLPIFAPIRESGEPGTLAPTAPRVRVVGLSVFAPVFVKYARG
jgi:uncharacterized protein DUF1707